MAPFKLIFTSVLVLISVHIMVLECTRICTGHFCACPSSCMCLGDYVDCSRKGLMDLPKDLPTWVQILDLQNNNIESVSSLVGLQNLTELDVSGNQLKIVNSTNFQSLPLQKLILNKNHLSELPAIGYHPTLTILSLQHNAIHSLNVSILEDFPRLQVLDLSFNHLVDLPANTFGNSTALQDLCLSHNRLVSLERGVFDNLWALESLKLSKNKLTSIPKELFRQLNTLRHLELSSNSLTTIEGLSFQGLSSLEVLKVRHSGITHLQDGAFYGLTSIKKLQLDNNSIMKVTKGWLYGLDSLQRLYINNNNILEIEDDAWDSGRRLHELDMSHNQLQSIGAKSFDKLYALKRLDLSDNLITYIEEDSFRSLGALQILELRNNEVSWTIEDTGRVFAGLGRLRYLGLSNNQVRAVVGRAFSDLTRLEVLNLTHNHITTVEEGAFQSLHHLQHIHMNTSSLLCDCRLSWMTRPKAFPFRVQEAKCGYPERLRGTNVFEVLPSQMICESSPKPVITVEPQEKKTLKGQNVTLECEARSSTHSQIHWRKDGRLLNSIRHPTRNYERAQGGNASVFASELCIQNIQDEDEGRYQCVISNKYGSVYSGKAHITVHVFPVFTKTPSDLSIKSGSTARLECGAKGQPSPKIVWRKVGEEFPAAKERRLHMIPKDEVFFIVSVKPSDAGVYSCAATNVAGTIVANATLTVLETPSFVKRMEDKETRAGETTVLECLSSGSPRPRLKWSKEGGPLQATERHFFTAGDQLLIIVQTQPSDAGTYTCEMSNALGTERGSSHLKVLQVSPSGYPMEESNATTGVIVIAVVICIVGTSIVWVVIIYRTRKRTAEDYPTPHRPPPSPSLPYPHSSRRPSPRNIFLDSHSGHSKDSGQQSSDDMLVEDEHDLLIEAGDAARFSGVPVRGRFLDVHCNGEGEVEPSGSSREQGVPLLRTFKTSRNNNNLHCSSLSHFRRWPLDLAQRSFSAEQLGGVQQLEGRGPPLESLLRTDSETTERDSGFSTFPRSITQVSVSNWSGDSPRFLRLPKDIPNDSGSFSIAGEEAVLPTRCLSVTTLPHTRGDSNPTPQEV